MRLETSDLSEDDSRDWFKPGAIDKKDQFIDSYLFVSPTLRTELKVEKLPQQKTK